jgi:hypothetical protein
MTAYSTDGLSWTAATLPTGARWENMAYGDGKFVAIAGNPSKPEKYAAYSTNGITWIAARPLPTESIWTDVVYGGGKFLAIRRLLHRWYLLDRDIDAEQRKLEQRGLWGWQIRSAFWWQRQSCLFYRWRRHLGDGITAW